MLKGPALIRQGNCGQLSSKVCSRNIGLWLAMSPLLYQGAHSDNLTADANILNTPMDMFPMRRQR